MIYDLKFRKNYQLDACRLEEYKAAYHKATELNHLVITGIHTREPEVRTSAIDRDNHLNPANGQSKEAHQPEFIRTIFDLWRRDNHGSRGY